MARGIRLRSVNREDYLSALLVAADSAYLHDIYTDWSKKAGNFTAK